jgi:hypothetical protein
LLHRLLSRLGIAPQTRIASLFFQLNDLFTIAGYVKDAP